MADLIQRITHSQVEPNSKQSTYTQFDSPVFSISAGQGRSVVRNSIRIVADLRVLADDAGTRTTSGRCFDKNVGGSAFIQSTSVRTQLQGKLETIDNFARYVKTDSCASKNEYDMLNASNACELMCVNQLQAVKYSNGVAPTLGTGTPVIKDIDFSIKPLCCINKTSRDIPFSKTGEIELQINLAKNQDALYGGDQDANSNYELRNLRCQFKTIPEQKDPSPVVMDMVNDVKSNMLSGSTSVSVNVNAPVYAMVANFIQVQHNSVNVFNSLALEDIKELAEVQMLFNESVSNSLVAYNMTDQTEMLERFIDAISNSSHNQVSKDKWKSNDAWALGLNFEDEVNLTNNRFTLNVRTNATNINTYPYDVYMYFFSRREI
jgi:hypothetical protein